jgi:hypothetical protein
MADKTLINICQTTRQNKQEHSHLHTHRRDKLKSHLLKRLVKLKTARLHHKSRQRVSHGTEARPAACETI